MDTLEQLTDISNRIDHLETNAEWIVRETTNNDSGLSQTATLILVLADELREKICSLVKTIEEDQTVSFDKLH